MHVSYKVSKTFASIPLLQNNLIFYPKSKIYSPSEKKNIKIKLYNYSKVKTIEFINYKMKKTNKYNVGSKIEGLEWEMRPGGMLVQKRNFNSYNTNSSINSIINVLVKYGSSSYEIPINSHASFGDLKKMLVQHTRLHPQDQKLIFKDKEIRESTSFLDVCGVKHGSKIILVQDILSQETRFLVARRNSNIDKALKSVQDVTMEVDILASQVTRIESVTRKGGKVDEKEILNLIELLMAQMIKLDGIVADGDVKLKRKMQVKRIQKFIETLDELKARNYAMTNRVVGGGHVGLIMSQQQREQRNFSSGQISLAIKWEKC